MATLLALLSSGRKRGFTAGLLDEAVRGAAAVEGVEVVRAWLHGSAFRPCISCFACIRNDDHLCTLPDAMGGGGALWRQVTEANALLLVDPVHGWGISAGAHTFLERLYPGVWSGRFHGMPFASISCASNQGFQHHARDTFCKQAYQQGFVYVGGLAVHVAEYDQGRRDAHDLGRQLARAALTDADARRDWSDLDRNLAYEDSYWRMLEPYLANLTRQTMDYDQSYVACALAAGTFHRPEATALLRQAGDALRQALDHFHAGRRRQAVDALTRTSAFWTQATWKEFLEDEVIGVKPPDAYRPLPGH